ncbi:isoflavone reductase [Fusarium oxysporum]|nr:isoflavone reductase [Fusarium oxysporum]
MKVVVIGASGETGRSIINGLLESPTEFEITAVTREASLHSKRNMELRGLGINVVAGDIRGPQDELVHLLTGAHVVISAVTATALADQIPLADAAKKAGVGRFVPCSFATVAPPRGVMKLREVKEDVLDHIKKIYLPYTLIDVGWWFPLSTPRLPSGRIDYALGSPMDRIIGDGEVPSARTHVKDVGRYVAKIVADTRTLNKAVFAYSEVLTSHEIFDIVERVSGEPLERKYTDESELDAQIAQVEKVLNEGSTEYMDTVKLWVLQYALSLGIRGDNTPEHARYLGYLIGKDLYPDMEFTTFEDYVKEMLEGTAQKPYS